MRYTQAVLQEVLRIACPVPGTGRSSASQVELDGLKLTKVIITIRLLFSELLQLILTISPTAGNLCWYKYLCIASGRDGVG